MTTSFGGSGACGAGRAFGAISALGPDVVTTTVTTVITTVITAVITAVIVVITAQSPCLYHGTASSARDGVNKLITSSTRMISIVTQACVSPFPRSHYRGDHHGKYRGNHHGKR